MSTETARLILYAIAGVEIVVWLAALRFVLAARNAGADGSTDGWETQGSPQDPACRVLSGSVEVEGNPESLAARATSTLAAGSYAGMGPVRILEQSGAGLLFEGSGWTHGHPQRGAIAFRVAVRFQAIGGGRSRAEYRIEVPGRRALLVLATVFQVLGLVAIVVGFWALRTYIMFHESPPVRGQVLQMLQAGHFLWIPFLLVAVYRRSGRVVEDAIRTLVHNVPYTKG